jgi:hypothetical protein
MQGIAFDPDITAFAYKRAYTAADAALATLAFDIHHFNAEPGSDRS